MGQSVALPVGAAAPAVGSRRPEGKIKKKNKSSKTKISSCKFKTLNGF